MRISVNALRKYVDLPDDTRAVRELLDDLGIEVKRIERTRDDDVFTVELLANRGDHHCYAGVAREVSGRTGEPIELPDATELATAPADGRIRVIADACLVYTATYLERATGGGSLPGSALLPLQAAGLHSVSAPVDATNLANLEIGQPTHAFDADTIVGPVVIRLSVAGEKAWPLFRAEKVDLPEGTLVIADDVKVLAIAGVIGCEESKTTDATTRILLESATFDPVSVRLASRALGIATDSSARFERGSDPTAPVRGAGRVVHLLEKAGWRVAGPTLVAGTWRDPVRVIGLQVAAAATFLEYPLTEREVDERLSRYGFTIDAVDTRERSMDVRVPPHRLWDVEFAADLYEELARSIGYNNTPSSLPRATLGAVPTEVERVRDTVEQVLCGAGFYEIITDGFYARDFRERMGVREGHPLWAHVETIDALDRAFSLLKNNALFQAVDAVATNHRMRHELVKAWEWTRTFHPDPEAENGLCTERHLVWAVVEGTDRRPTWDDRTRPGDAIFVKGVVEELAIASGVPLQIGPADPADPLHSLLHPGRQASIRRDGKRVGVLGEVHPSVVAAFKLKKARPVYMEIEIDALLDPPKRAAFVMPGEHHLIVRNLAFTLPDRTAAGDVADHMKDSGPAWLTRVDMTDVFAHEVDGKPVRTVTYELVFHSGDEARTADEINAACDYLVHAVSLEFGDRGVTLRA